ncbi:hypothetical protein EHS25_007892 [Saitozyma podzolica]|uniref:Manganese/iron superoxide dismutase C-terminal domain-containing protein n=1 Tax=Saitozyma podzolica TaxID=1890683 RepID=A0A427YQZ2_9TREE|nr:hypothetical protein EHS25_007892 [Saitozyma podzolica]
MSRAAPSLLRSIPSASRPTLNPLAPINLSRRSIFPAPGSSPRASRPGGNTSSVDPRVLEGLPNFLPKGNVDNVCAWQAGLWERLQAEVRNNPALLPVKQKWESAGLDMTHLLTYAAREPSLSLAFNYASLLLNNSFFLEGLNAGEPVEVPDYFRHLEQKVEAYADGIVGSAWLWLVRSGNNVADVDIVPTFASGTLLVTHRQQRGREALPLFAEPSNPGVSDSSPAAESEADASADASPASPPLNQATASRKLGGARAAETVYPVPIAVLSLHEHAYLGEKYGVWDRKQYARNWWKSLDWRRVK